MSPLFPLKNQVNAKGLDRRPDVWVEDRVTGEVRRVYEAARLNRSGEFVSREGTKAADYNKYGIRSHFEEVR